MSSTANRIIKNTGYLYAKMGITMFISLYTTRLILNSLGASDFGIYNIVGGAIAMLGFLNSAMAGATQRFMSFTEGEGNKEKQKGIFNVSLVLHFCIAIIAGVALIIAGIFFFNGILNIPTERVFAAKVVYGSFIVSTMFTVMTVPYDAAMNAHENMRYYAIVGIVESLLKLSVAFVCVYTLFDKLIVYGSFMASIPLITLTIMRVYCHRHYEECTMNLKHYWDKGLMKEMTSFAGWNFCSSAASFLTMQGMSIVLNMFGGVIVNAAHGIANQVSGMLMVFSNNMLKALNPVLVKSRGAGDTNKMLRAAASGNKLSFLIYTFFAIPFIMECPFILDLWLKNTPDYAVLFVRLVLIRQMVSQMMVALDTCISATGNISKFTISSSVIWISPLVISYIMYKHGAPIETIYILLICASFARIVNSMVFCHILCKLRYKDYIFNTILPCIGQSIIIFSILLLINFYLAESWMRVGISLLVTVIFHPTIAYFVSFSRHEQNMVKDFIRVKIQHKTN